MRVASYTIAARSAWGLVEGDMVSDLTALPGCETVEDAIAMGLGDTLPLPADAPRYRLTDVTYALPITRPGKVLCVGRNYVDHLAEGADATPPKYPGLFMRTLLSLTPHEGPIVRPRASDALDYEGEVCVVIGKPGRDIPAERALEHVFGYTCFNDGSLRDFQSRYKAIVGKNFPSTGGIGPWIVTADEIPDPSALTLETRLNGTVMQHSDTSKMIFDIGAIIAFVSVFTELRPGDLIMTGTPEGVGKARKPPVWMKPGDVVEVEIGGVGVLRNTIVAE
ncbi:fumarylacetoacetate hydrolase family protein [Acuticoccus mangrovi]|uniref:Fumarylacetoacetate hydrolase family protein n=1 Tax=Acuticoccus mangrovi TaxID=2796142 RepID=A0A934IS66_9HYPH|nr:fumarylacetoacetate hydrolase family protein [Acuticoccus mangrovi]MBJ3777075.1 fumarylacetoacetate hydrolase family protein [Acuticoccus mangrovi]